MDIVCFTLKKNVPLMREGASVVWRLLFPLINNFNPGCYLPMQGLLPYHFPAYRRLIALYCISKRSTLIRFRIAELQ